MRTSGAVVDSWRGVAWHASVCSTCADVELELRRVPDQPAALYDRLCPDGRQAYEAWDATKRELPADPGSADVAMAAIRARRELLGFVGLSPEAADRRSRAIGSVPPEAYAALLALPADQREANIRSLVAGQPEPRAMRAPQERSEPQRERAPHHLSDRMCASCGRPIGDRPPRERYCSPECRRAARPALFGTED